MIRLATLFGSTRRLAFSSKCSIRGLTSSTQFYRKSNKRSSQIMNKYRERPEEMFNNYFESSKEIGTDYVNSSTILSSITNAGISLEDPRLSGFIEGLKRLSRTRGAAEHYSNTVQGIKMNADEFREVTHEDLYMLMRVASDDFCIPNFGGFKETIGSLFEECREINEGRVADYIPQLAKMSPNSWAVSVCTIDGQMASFGDYQQLFTLQSAVKPISYALALTELGSDEVHKFVGYEPSGLSFNKIVLNQNNKPHNPLINSGAIVVASLIKRHLSSSERFNYVKQKLSELAGDEIIGFNSAVHKSERQSADRNYALAYYMREKNCFPAGTPLEETMELYFQMCSMETNCRLSAIVASSLAQGGLNTFTGKQVLSAASVRDTLSVMLSCGMYDYSGQFAFKVGLPAKSGVSGIILLVIPDVIGVAVWSPRINLQGNSVRGLVFCEKLVQRYVFHHYETSVHSHPKRDPRKNEIDEMTRKSLNILFAANNNDIASIRQCMLAGYDLNGADYDGRTALHVASSSGAFDVVRFLIEVAGVELNSVDRWGNTALSEAKRFNHKDVAQFIAKALTDRYGKGNSK